MLLVPVEVCVTSWPSLMVVMTVMNSWREVETRWLVLVTGAVLGDEAGGLLLAGPGVVRGDEGWLGVDCAGVDAGGLEVGGSVTGSSLGVGWGVGVGCAEVGERGGEGEGVGVLPVPVACRFSPWWRYSSMPSMRKSSRLKADDSATRAKIARTTQSFRSMFGGGVETKRAGERKGVVRVYTSG